MRGSGTRCSSNELVLVLDTAAFLAGVQLLLYSHRLATVPRVLEEVKDSESVLRLEIAIEASRIEVVEPLEEYRRRAENVTEDVGARGKLSQTDIDVLALALQLRDSGCRVIIVTDDYTLQNVAALSGIEFRPVKTMGIRKPRRFKR